MIHDLDTLAYQTLELVVGFSVCVQFPLLFHILSPAYLSLGFSFSCLRFMRGYPLCFSCECFEYSFQRSNSSFLFSCLLFILGPHFHVAFYVWQRARRILLLSTFTYLHVADFRHDLRLDQLQLSAKF